VDLNGRVMIIKYIPKPASEFIYEYDSDLQIHMWYDNKNKGLVFTFSNEFYSKETSFEEVKFEVEKRRSQK
jgi:hypothetical protein